MTRRQVSVLAARDSFSRLVASVSAGEEVEITRRGEPVAQLTPVLPGVRSGAELADLAEACRIPADRRRSAARLRDELLAERDSWD